MTKKVWTKPELEYLDINRTEAASLDHPDHDEAYNGDNTRRKPNGRLVLHHES
ncbi:paeninodin family lasso peptide [Bacillus pinisoli]|uniref:paeninodin family lasso peptide n=1 Tax=Bacillus pinisoli TaxID=2901866 RepID=UPI001FF27037|nr:paeninodin family lasso peptide [Bacillus pinisoli]